MSEDLLMRDGGETMQLEIQLEPAWELRNWTRWLGCSEAELRLAVETMGPDPDNVRRFLRHARC